MRITIYIACLVLGLAATPYVAFASTLVSELSVWLGSSLPVSGDVVVLLARFAVTTVLLLVIHGLTGLLSGELNLPMAVLSGIVPLYNGLARFIGNLTGSRLSLNEIFYSHSTRDITTFGGFGDAVVAVGALLISWLLVRKLLTVSGIRSFSV